MKKMSIAFDVVRQVGILVFLLFFCLAWPTAHARQDASDLTVAEISAAALPPEARATLVLIERGGPFPYARDGSVFQNRERLLPLKPRGHYREYTVPTPGSRDRGARRIVRGEPNEFYYTPDHYRSFKRIRK